MTKTPETVNWGCEGVFARQVQVEDVPSIFRRRLTLLPGTQALLVENGVNLGTVGPGVYTLETFGEKLTFWSKKQMTAILAPESESSVQLVCPQLMTEDGLLVDIQLQLAIRIDDVALFQRNLLGAKQEMTSDELTGLIAPILRQATGEGVAQLTIAKLKSNDSRALIEAALDRAVMQTLERYGLKFIELTVFSITHPQYDEQSAQRGEIVLYNRELDIQGERYQAEAEAELQRIENKERVNDLAILEKQVDADNLEGEMAIKLRRIGIRNEWREAVRSEEFDKIQDKQELEIMLLAADKGKLARQAELEELKETFAESSEDRQNAREHLLHRIEVEQESEIEQLRSDMQHELVMRRTQQEIELAEIAQTKEGIAWSETLKRRASEREEKKKENDFRREEAWQEELNARRIAALQGKARDEEGERKTKRREQKLKILREMQEMNIQFDRDQAEIRQMEENAQAERDREYLLVFGQQSIETQVMMGQAENAGILADWKKTEATSDVERAKLEGRLEAMQESQAQQQAAMDRTIEAYKDGQKNITEVTGQVLGAQQAKPGSPTGKDAEPEVLCPKCRAKNASTAAFCNRCGERL